MDALVADALTRRFGATEALRGLSFRIPEGELYGLVGPDAAGKTTTIRALSGLINPDSGTVKRKSSMRGTAPVFHCSSNRSKRESNELRSDITTSFNKRFPASLF